MAIAIVVEDGAPALEKRAADELRAQLQRLRKADVTITSDAAQPADLLILLGSPRTNAAVKRATHERWPKLSDQGHILKSVRLDGRPALVIGGGSPVATLWAAYELGHLHGVRYLLRGDVYPPQPADVKLDQLDMMLEPSLRLRSWNTIDDSAIGLESWGLAEQRKLLGQLAKLKFNRVVLSFSPWQPFVDYSYRGVKKSTATLGCGFRYRVDGDTPGRAAFHGAHEFYNPDLAGKATGAELTAAGIALARGIIDAARELGMTTAISFAPLAFPPEFAAVLPRDKPEPAKLAIGPAAQQGPADPVLMELATAQVRAYLDTYPQADAVYLSMSEYPDWVEHADDAWRRLDARTAVNKVTTLEKLLASAAQRPSIASADRGIAALRGNVAALDFFSTLLARQNLWKRADGREWEVHLAKIDPALFPILGKVIPLRVGVLHLRDETARRQAAHRDSLSQVPAKNIPSLVLALADEKIGILPQNATSHVRALLSDLRRLGWAGFSTRPATVGDLDPAVYLLSRASFAAEADPSDGYATLFAPICGQHSAERMTLAFDAIEEATDLLDEKGFGSAFAAPDVMMKHYTNDAVPGWWKDAARRYTTGMNEMLRAQDASLASGRSLTTYYAKHCEFAVEYLGAVEAVRLAGQAKAEGDGERQLAQLERAVEGLYNALIALGAVARDQSDRGVIAVLVEHGYRPLLKEFESVSATAP